MHDFIEFFRLNNAEYVAFQTVMAYGAVGETNVSGVGGKDDLNASIRSTASRTKDKRSKNAARCVNERARTIQERIAWCGCDAFEDRGMNELRNSSSDARRNDSALGKTRSKQNSG